MGSPLFNVRVSDELDDAITAAAEQSGVKKSTWAREVLAAVALGGVTMADLRKLIEAAGKTQESPHPERFLTLQSQTGRRELVERSCVHPTTARKQLAFKVICGLCGGIVKRT